MMKRIFLFGTLCILCLTAMAKIRTADEAANYSGRVVDEAGQPLMYATIYLLDNPQIGTATNADGFFTLTTDSIHSTMVVSSLGYETAQWPISYFATGAPVVQLKEQPIWIAPTLVKGNKIPTSKRKKNASYIHAVYQRLQEEWPKTSIMYDVVSNTKIDMNASTMLMEQMIAKIVQIPSEDYAKDDSIQFVGSSCKRYCHPSWRNYMDSLLDMNDSLTGKMIAMALDSSTLIHSTLWTFSSLDKSMVVNLGEELSHWKAYHPDDQHMVLTYKRSVSFFITFIANCNLLIDNSASLEKSSMDIEIRLFSPVSFLIFGLDSTRLDVLSIGGTPMDDFRAKKGNITAHFETKYQLQDGVRMPSEISIQASGQVEDKKGKMATITITAKQKVTAVQTQDVQPFDPYNRFQIIGRKEVPMQ